jgi:hypothetical protein
MKIHEEPRGKPGEFQTCATDDFLGERLHFFNRVTHAGGKKQNPRRDDLGVFSLNPMRKVEELALPPLLTDG